MKIQVLGSGSAFTLKNYQTSFLINDKLLFDCGGDVRFAMRDIGKTYKDINDVFISHLHGDHVGGLEWLGFTNYFDPSQERPNLYLSEVLVDPLWNDCLKGGMGSLQGKIATLSTYFKVEAVQPNELFVVGKLVCTPVQTIHIMNGFLFVPSFGLMVSEVDSNKRVYFTGDTQYAPAQIMDFYKMADMIIHDCEYLYMNDGTPIMSKVHAHYEELKALPEDIKKKMYLVHFQDAMSNVHVTDDGFLGKLEKGWEFNVEDVE